MKNPPRLRRSFWRLALLLVSFYRVLGVAAVVPTEWQSRQSLVVAAPGLVKVALPAATFDAAQAQLPDLRLVDAAGQEVPYLLDRDLSGGGGETPAAFRPKSFRASPNGDVTQLLIETGRDGLLDAIDLETSVPFFLKAAHVEISADGATWRSAGAATPVFRQFGAEQLRLAWPRQAAAFVRVTLDDFRSRPIAFTGAQVWPASSRAAPPVVAPLGASITRREEFAGETVLTVTLDGRQVWLASLTLETKEALFMRRVAVTVREARDAVSAERTVGAGTLYRVALDGALARAQLELPCEFMPPTRELLVHIHNGDSPPLAVEGVQASQHPVNLLFLAATAGSYTLLSGNPQASPPRYDLAAFAGEMRGAGATLIVPGALEEMPNYHPRESLATAPLPDVPLAGAPLDTSDWSRRKAIHLTRAGVQELELDLPVLAHARPGLADLRLMRGGNQIPYVLEQPALERRLALTPEITPDPKHPNVSVWRLTLPESQLPLHRLTLSSSTPLFRRELRVYEKLTDQNGANVENGLASGSWSRTPDPGMPETKSFELSVRPRTTTLWVESDNGDNPPIVLGAAHVTYPVVRLVFKTADTDGFSLVYDRAAATAPRYDLSLVAPKLVTASRNVAQLAVDQTDSIANKASGGITGGPIFWGALSLVVVALLFVVAKLLPKPTAPP